MCLVLLVNVGFPLFPLAVLAEVGFTLFHLAVLAGGHLVVARELLFMSVRCYFWFHPEHFWFVPEKPWFNRPQPAIPDEFLARAAFQTSQTIFKAHYILSLISGLYFLLFWWRIDSRQYIRSGIAVALARTSLLLAYYNKSIWVEPLPTLLVFDNLSHPDCLHQDDVPSPQATSLPATSTPDEIFYQRFFLFRSLRDSAFKSSVKIEVTVTVTIALGLFIRPRRWRLPKRYEPTVRLSRPERVACELHSLQNLRYPHGGSISRPLSTAFKNQIEPRSSIKQKLPGKVST